MSRSGNGSAPRSRPWPAATSTASRPGCRGSAALPATPAAPRPKEPTRERRRRPRRRPAGQAEGGHQPAGAARPAWRENCPYGFCAEEQHALFLRPCPALESMPVEDGIILVLVRGLPRGAARPVPQVDPVRQWKPSPTDLASLDLWNAYTAAEIEMFRATDTAAAPWTVVKSNDTRRGRLEAKRHLLWRIDCAGKDAEAVGRPDPLIVGAAGTLLEPGEEPSALSPRRPRPSGGPGAGTRPHENGSRVPAPDTHVGCGNPGAV
ncbi:hypothetical protein ACFW8X_36955, partial [Streptomyces sp. NPDC058718]